MHFNFLSILSRLFCSRWIRGFSQLLLVLAISLPTLNAQNPITRSINTSHGLPTNIVYQSTQDDIGRIWLATDNGICVYDGTGVLKKEIPKVKDHFFAFVQKDSFGNIWMSNISGQLYCHANSEIKQADISTELKEGALIQFCIIEDKLWIMIGDSSSKHRVVCYQIFPDGHLEKKIEFGKKNPVQISAIIPDNGELYVSYLSRVSEKSIITLNNLAEPSLIFKSDNIVLDMASLVDGSFLVKEDKSTSLFHYSAEGKSVFKLNSSITTLVSIDDIVYIGTSSGYYKAEIFNKELKISGPFYSHLSVNSIFQCRQGILWLSTYNNGLVIQPDSMNLLFPIIDDSGRQNGIPAMVKTDDGLLVGTDNGQLVRVKEGDVELLHEFPSKINHLENRNSDLLVAGSRGLWSWSSSNGADKICGPTIKTMDLIDDAHVLLSLNFGAEIYDIDNNESQEITPELNARSYACLTINSDSILVGNTDGLFLYDLKRKQLDGPMIEYHISDIEIGFDSYYVSTFSNGVFQLDLSGRVHKLELSSNNIKDIDYADKKLAIATDQGVLVYDAVEKTESKINKFNYLPTDNVESVLIDGDILWVGSEAGLCKVQMQTIESSLALLDITRISNGDSIFTLQNDIILNTDNRNIRFEYLASSFNKTSELNFVYRLLGYDTTWIPTKLREVSYSNMLPGDYEFQLKAGDDQRITELMNVPFVVAKKWYESFVFRLLSLAAFGFLIFCISRFYLQRRMIEEKQKNEEVKKIEGLQMTALQNHMNPHFVSNALYSIQDLINDNRKWESSEFTSNFAEVVRLSMSFATTERISLSQELKFLAVYIELEEKRFRNKLNIELSIDNWLDNNKAELFIPPLLIQPILENAFKHADLRNSDNPTVKIDLSRSREFIICTIEDNGIGFKMNVSKEKVKKKHHRSTGMETVKERLRLNASQLNNEINEQDLLSIGDAKPRGTIARLKITYLLQND